MAMVKVPGLKGSKGMVPFEAYAPGKYKVEINAVKLTEKENEKGKGVSWEFKSTILDSPEQANGKAADGRPYTFRIYLMDETHSSYEEWHHIGVDELESLRMACGIDKKGDSIDPDAFVGEKAVITVAQETVEYKGANRTQNVNRKYEAV